VEDLERENGLVRGVFFAYPNKREQEIAHAWMSGVLAHGAGERCDLRDSTEYVPPDPDIDYVCIIGIRWHSKQIVREYRAAGKHVLFVDKGYTRARILRSGQKRPQYWRISVDEFQPHAYFQQTPRPSDMWDALNIAVKEQIANTGKGHIVVAGGSLHYAVWHGLKEGERCDPATAWAHETCMALTRVTETRIIYRPKPSWPDAPELDIKKIRTSRANEPLKDLLRSAKLVVTYGSNAGLDALIMGVPVLTLGDGITRPMGRNSIAEPWVNNPRFPSDEDRMQFLYDMAYCQFRLGDMRSGAAWDILKEQVT